MSAPPLPHQAGAVRPPTGHTAAIALDPEATVALLSRMLRGTPRLPGALCVDHPALFDERDPRDPDRPGIEAQAIAVCQTCPALAACRRWVDRLPPRHRPNGVIAGTRHTPATTPTDRTP